MTGGILFTHPTKIFSIYIVTLNILITREISMLSHRWYMIISGTLFLFVGLLHGTRAYYEWEMFIDALIVPTSVSWFAAAVLLFLSYNAFRTLKTNR